MSHIVLSHEQLQRVTQAKNGVIEVRDPNGRCVGYFGIASEQETIEECKRRRESNTPTFSTQQVKSHFRALEEAAQQGASEEQLWEVLKKVQNGPQQ